MRYPCVFILSGQEGQSQNAKCTGCPWPEREVEVAWVLLPLQNMSAVPKMLNEVETTTRSLKIAVLVQLLSLKPHGLQHTRLCCPSPSTRACSNSCALSQWCHPTISSSVVPFSSCLLSFPASGSFPMSRLFASGASSIGVSATVLPMNIQSWFPLRLTGLISLQFKGLSRVFFNTTV